MNVTCPSCETVYRVDPGKVPPGGVRARCAVCSSVFAVNAAGAVTAGAPSAAAAPPPAPPAPPRAPRAPPPAQCCPERAARPAHDRAAAPGESLHGAGPEAEGPSPRAGARVRPGGVPSGEAPAGLARRHAAAAVQGRDREELAGVRGAGRARDREEHVVLGRSAERDSGRGQPGILRLALGCTPWH